MMRKHKKTARLFSAISAAVLTIMVGTCALAGTLLEHNGSMYSMLLKSEQNFSDGKYTARDNGIGIVSLDTLDDEHGPSVGLGASNEVDIFKEGAWMQINGDKSQAVSVYEIELYVERMERGNLRFFQKGINSGSEPAMYLLTISKDGISNGSETRPFEFGAWHKIRFMYDCSGHSYAVYVDDMENATFSGGFNDKMAAVQYMRVTLWAADAYVAVDNFKYYSLIKMIDGYELPRFSLVPAEGRITESELAHIEAKIETRAEIEKVDFYVNDELLYTDTEAPYILENVFDKGDYTIYAIATDVYGESGEAALNITSYADTKPRIMLGLKDGGKYDKSVLGSIPVTVTMSDAEFAEGTVSADGTKIADLASQDNIIDLSGLSIGRHTVTVYAKNNLGEYAETTVSITVEKSFDDEIWSMNFNDGSTLGTLNGSGQFTRLETLREDFKDSLLVGANTTQDVNLEGAWIPFDFKNTTTAVEANFDIYFNNINGQGMTVMLVLPTKRPVLFKITKDGIVTGDGSVVGSFEAGRWYHATLKVDAQALVYSLSIDGEEIFTDRQISNMEQGTAMHSIRLISMLQGTEETYFAVDNVSVRQITQAPSIVNITSSKGSENTVSTNDKKIKVYFSGALQSASVYPAKFTISGAVVEQAVYDAANYCVTLTLKQPLSAGTYRLVTAENLVMGNGEIYAEKLYGDFTVTASMFEAISSDVSADRITAKIINNSNDSKTVYMIIDLYNGDMLKTSTVKEINLVSGENLVYETINGYTSGDKAEIFMWDYLTAPNCFISLTN